MLYKNYINGKWQSSFANETYQVYNPSSKYELVGTITASSEADVDLAVESAVQGSKIWKNLSSVERGDYLHLAANLLEARAEEIAELATKEMGKRIAETKGEALRGVSILRYYAQEGLRKIGELLPSAGANKVLYSMRVPLGVVGVISPWNFPIAIPLWKIAPALIYGNTVVWKAAKNASATATKVVEIFAEAGLPPGVLNLVNGPGAVVGDRIVKHPHIAGVTFTGSNSIGLAIAEKAVKGNKKYQLELGGKNPAIVLEDADLALAAQLVVEGAMKQTGQRCTATSRAFIQRSIYEKFKEKVVNEVKKISLGRGLDPNINMGPVASQKQFEIILKYIEIGQKEGAKLVYGGQGAVGELFDQGYYIEPTIFEDVSNEMVIAQEEIFGPVLCLIAVDTYEDALRQANKTIYGLSASLFTTNLRKAFHFIENSEVGMAIVNGETGGAEPQAPFGGIKQSGSGSHEQGQAAVEFFTNYKTITITP